MSAAGCVRGFAYKYAPRSQDLVRAFDGEAWIVFWWYAQEPHILLFTNPVAAEAAAKIRNAAMVHVKGTGSVETDSFDWYRRDHEACKHPQGEQPSDCGKPMPIQWGAGL